RLRPVRVGRVAVPYNPGRCVPGAPAEAAPDHLMTGSAHADIDAVIKLWNTGKRQQAMSMVFAQDMRGRLQDEMRRIAAPGGRDLLHPDNGDFVSKRIYGTIRDILAATA